MWVPFVMSQPCACNTQQKQAEGGLLLVSEGRFPMVKGNSGRWWAVLTCSAAEADSAQDVALEAVTLPHGQLGAGLPQVAALEAVVHHGVVVLGADGALHHPSLLAALSAGVWQDVAGHGGHSQHRSLISVVNTLIL